MCEAAAGASSTATVDTSEQLVQCPQPSFRKHSVVLPSTKKMLLQCFLQLKIKHEPALPWQQPPLCKLVALAGKYTAHCILSSAVYVCLQGEAIAFALGGNRKMLRAGSLAGLVNQERRAAGCRTAQVRSELKMRFCRRYRCRCSLQEQQLLVAAQE
jgi:hypothetical protein